MTVITSRFDTKITAKSQWKGRKRRKNRRGHGRQVRDPRHHGEGQGRALLLKCLLQPTMFRSEAGSNENSGLGGQQCSVKSLHFQRGECLLLYLEQITSKDLLQSTRSSAHYSVLTCMGQELANADTSVWIPGSPCCTPETNAAVGQLQSRPKTKPLQKGHGLRVVTRVTHMQQKVT